MKRRFTTSTGKLILLLIAMVSLHISICRAQDPQFSQYYASPIYTNPAFAGSSTVARGVINYRSQWPSISGTFRTVAASYDEHFDVINGGIGVMVTADEAGEGTLRSISLNGIYAYQISVSKYFTIRAAVQAAVFQKSIDFGKLKFADQIVKQKGFIYETNEPLASPTIYLTNFSTGLIAYSNYFYGGVAVHNLNEPYQTFFQSNDSKDKSKVPMKITGHAGLMIPIIKTKNEKRATSLYPNVLYMQQKHFSQINAGMYLSKGFFVVGGYFRQSAQTSDAIIMVLGLRQNKFRLGFSYDATLSEARPGAAQSYEFSLAFELRKRIPRKSVRSIKCPEF